MALFGALAAFLSEHAGTPWPLVAGMILVGAMSAGLVIALLLL
ncbi:MAG TPA: hypothetical protein VMP00_06980 [Burkholderiales bacterium]|nr:hypothetical protein [Burkholderiales bacterium]